MDISLIKKYNITHTEKNGKVIFINNWKKGFYINHSVTDIPGQKEKYGYTLQEVNDRINSYRPNTITNYKFSGDSLTLLELKSKQLKELKEWDGKTWNYGEYLTFGDPKEPPDSKLFKDFKILAKSAAKLKGYFNLYKVRGGTAQDIEDFINFVVIKLIERRNKGFDFNSECRILDNWPSHIALVITQFLILFNKSKCDYEVETFWPMVKDSETGEFIPKDIGYEPIFHKELISREGFIKILDGIFEIIPESEGIEIEVLYYLLYGTTLYNRDMINILSEIVKKYLAEAAGRIALED